MSLRARMRLLALVSFVGAIVCVLAAVGVAFGQPLPQVQGLTLTEQPNGRLLAQWQAVPGATNGYIVEYGTTIGSWRQRSTSATQYFIPPNTDPDPGQTYYVRVSARPNGPPSAIASATACGTISTVTGVRAQTRSASEIDVIWDPAGCADGYRVQWATDAGFSQGVGEEIVSATTACRSGICGVTITGRMAMTEYFVRVTARRFGTTQGSASSADTATTEESQMDRWIQRVPGGAVSGQFILALIAGVAVGSKAKGMRSPRREAVIAGCMGLGGCIIPALGMGNTFWMWGIPLLVIICAVGTIFIARR